ncbi:MAG TPA: single-stranded-DNA-specific exonuclease RecJ [Candidatus Bathyarchaeia archaeon]|nr:single-stranded-DNA-specific exonuclease RecJ [Candidatus Bathyarchaeia archaeon]
MEYTVIRGEKYIWKVPICNQEEVASTAAAYTLSFPVAQVLYSRGYRSSDAIDAFLFTSFERAVTHASQLTDAQKAVDRIKRAIEKQEKILVFGDYDVDGITSSALMMACLVPLGAQINFFLPHRARDGYGLSTKVVERAARNGYTLIITVDNGIAAFEPASRARELNIDLIITDHHRAHGHLPVAYAIVNPQRADCTYPFKMLAGVGVIFKVLSLLYEQLGKALPPKAYELLMLGTIADVVPLQGENRWWVRQGIAQVHELESLSFRVLKENGKIVKPTVTATDIGFSITPQINALGRLDDPRDAVQFLIGSDAGVVQSVGRVLHELNERRKEVEQGIIFEIEQVIAQKKIDLEREYIIMASSESWPPGVIGLVASRLVGKYGRPVLLFHITKDGIAKGSCRSIADFNMFDALSACTSFISQFGGHSVAAGLSLPAHNLSLLKQTLEDRIQQTLTRADLQQKINLDGELALPDATKKTMHDIACLEPFGHQNDAPLFYVPSVTIVQKPQLLKGAHVKCMVFSQGVVKPLIFFNRPELYDFFMISHEKQLTCSLAAKLTENFWQERVSIELIGVDVAKSKE